MRYIKSKSDLRIKVCYTPEELATLAVAEDIKNIFEIAKNNHNIEDAKKHVAKLSEKRGNNSKSYEYFVGILDLYELFEQECEFCFNLKPSFNPSLATITSSEDLNLFKVDPPDIIVLNKGGFHDFELKRYRNPLEVSLLLEFLNEKIINYYSDHNKNYLIILQPKPNTEVSLDVFHNLRGELVKLNKNLGIIAFSSNIDNQKSVLIKVWPQFEILQRPFLSGSEQIKRIFLKRTPNE